MESDLNKKIEEIYEDFKLELEKLKKDKDKKISELLESAEAEYVEKIKEDIKF